MSPSSGTKLGPYEILSLLGAGGMGEVYRARDTRLDRIVAIKVLPESSQGDSGIKARFEREARAISSLQHPHICTLYDVGHQDGAAFLVMEFLEGDTLAHRLLRGALPADVVAKIGAELADALAKAHRQGILHRDLKPANIMMTKSGAKLMDFGLAKERPGLAPGALSNSAAGPLTPSTPTVDVSQFASSASPLTQKGSIVGTFQYIAPEVLRGSEADARSDIFSFGCVLYEMATGKRAFDGKSHLGVLTAILEKDPEPVTTLQPNAPAGLAALIRTCLSKEPDERWQTAADLQRALSLVQEVGPQSRAVSKASKRVSSNLMVGATALLLVCGAFLMGWWQHRPPVPALLSSELELPQGTIVDTLNDSIAISPDGRALAFGLLKSDGTSQLWIRQLGTGQTTPVPDTVGAAYPFWSPDGASLGYFANGKLMRVDLANSVVQAVCDAPLGRGGTWNQAGRIVFAPDLLGGLFEVPASGGTPTDLAITLRTNDSLRIPRFLPDGDHLLFLRFPLNGQSHIEVLSLASRNSVELLQADSAAQYSTGQLLFVRGNNLFAQDFDSGRMRLTGQPAVIAAGVQVDPARRTAEFSVSNAGMLVYAPGGDVPLKQLQWIDSSGKVAGTIGEPAGYYYEMELSPDGKLAVALSQSYQLSIVDLASGGEKPFSLATTALDSNVVWSPDGKWLAYTARISDKGAGIHLIATDGRTQSKLVYTCHSDPCLATSWSRDGKMLALQDAAVAGGDHGVSIISISDGRQLYFLPHAGQGEFSPDGKWMAFNSPERGKSDVYVTAIPPGQEKWQVTSGGGQVWGWPIPGTIFYSTNEDKIASISVKSQGMEFHVGQSEIRFNGRPFPSGVDWDITNDGTRVLAAVPAGSNSSHSVKLIQNRMPR
jgi:serine/threonine protein kinase